VNRPARYTTGRAVLAIAGAAAALAAGGCGGGASGASKQTVAPKTAKAAASKTAEAPAPANKLLATVSTTGQVTLTDSRGRAVTRLHSGWYSIFVTVNAAGADFHLTGPSVDSATKTRVPGVALWGLHLLTGSYRYMNDRDARATTRVLSVY
jgi:hypothetical protein